MRHKNQNKTDIIGSFDMANSQLAVSPIMGAVADMARFQEAISPTIMKTVVDVSRMQEAISPTILKAVADVSRLQEVISPAIMRAVADMGKLHAAIAPKLMGMLSDIEKLNEVVLPDIEYIVNGISDVVTNFSLDDISVNDDGIFSVSDKKFEISEIQDLIDECTTSAQSSSVETKLYNLFVNASKKHPVYAQIILIILIPILNSIISGLLLPTTTNN